MKPDKSNVARLDRTVFVLLVMLLVVRVGMVAAYPVLVKAMPQWGWANNDGYDTIAANLVATGTFALETGIPTAARLPLYPWVIAACYAIFGDVYPVAVMLIQALLSFSTGVYLYLTTRTLFDRKAAIATTALFILHPQANNFVFRCATETLFSFLVMAALYHVVRYVQEQKLKELVLATWWLSLSLLTRQTLAPMAFACLPLLLLIRTGSSPRFVVRLLRTLVAVITAVLVLAPWVFRNYVHSGYAPVLQTWVGRPMFQGTYVSRHLSEFLQGEKTLTDLDMEALSRIREKTNVHFRDHSSAGYSPVAREVLADRYARKLVRDDIVANPVYYAGAGLRNVILAPVLQMTWKSTAILMLWNWPLLIVASLGSILCFFRHRKRFVQALPVVVLFFYMLGIHAIVWPQARYILPGLLPFTAFAGLIISRFAVLRTCRA